MAGSRQSILSTGINTGMILSMLVIVGCSSQPSRYSLKQDSGPDRHVDVNTIPDAIPRTEARSKWGNSNYVVNGKRYRILNSSKGYFKRGIASWYGKKFHGHRTSNGETYDMYKMTAAHRALPLPSYVRVTYLRNGRSVIVRVNDRGPFHPDRVIDLSYAAAKKLGIIPHGTGVVEIETVTPENAQPAKTLARNNYRYSSRNNLSRSKSSIVKAGSASTSGTTSAKPYSIFLQAGAFLLRNNAEMLFRKIRKLNLAHTILIAFEPVKKLYRVRIGPLASVEQADNLASQISNLNIATPHIIVE